MEKKNGYIEYLYLVVTFFLWGSLYVVTKLATSALPGPAVVASRAVVAVLTLLVMARKQEKPKIQKEHRKYFLLISLLGYFGTQMLVTFGITLSGSSMAALVNSLTPVSITIVAALVLREKIDTVKILCLVLAIAGTCVVTVGELEAGSMIGIVCVLFSLVAWALASIFVRRMTQYYPAIIVTLYGLAISLCFGIPAAALSIALEPSSVNLTWQAVGAILYLGIAGTGLAQFCWSRSLSKLEASFCSMFYPLQAVFSAILGAILLGERFKPLFFVGLVLIAADVVLICLHNNRLEKKMLVQKGAK